MKDNSNKTSFEKAMEYAEEHFKRMDMSKIPDIDESKTEEELEREIEELNKNFEEWLKEGTIIYKGKQKRQIEVKI